MQDDSRGDAGELKVQVRAEQGWGVLPRDGTSDLIKRGPHSNAAFASLEGPRTLATGEEKLS